MPKKAIKGPATTKLSEYTPDLPPSDVLALVRKGNPEAVYPLRDKLAETYYTCRGSLPKTCLALGLSYQAVLKLRKDNEDFKELFTTLDELLVDEVRHQFMGNVLDPNERNPAWKIFYLKKNDPRYADRPPPQAGVNITLNFKDPTIKPIIDIEPIEDGILTT
mgnify:CR=1 FL=1